MRRYFRDLLAGACLIAATMLAYAPVFQNEFVNFDDNLYIFENPHVLAGLSWPGIQYAFTTFDVGNWMPLTWISLELTTSLFGAGPQAFHGVNLAYHAVNTVLFFAFLRSSTGAFWRSLVAAGLWGLHPLHVESVAWASERKDVLSLFWLLVAVLLYVRYAARPNWPRYVPVLGATSLGFMCKSVLVTTPALLLLLDVWPLGRTRWVPPASGAPVPRRDLRQLCLEKIPLCVLAFPVGLVTLLAQGSTHALSFAGEISLPVRLGNALQGTAWYLLRTVWPVDLAANYAHPLNNLNARLTALAAIVVFLLSVVVWLGRRQAWRLVGWLWFLIALLPMIGIIQVGTQAYADRYAYLPQLGLLTWIVWESWRWISLLAPREAVAALLSSASLIVCGALTAVQVGYWHDSETLWRRALAVDPHGWFANYQFGSVLLSHGRATESREYFERALSVIPDLEPALVNLGWIHEQRGELEQAEELYSQLLKKDPRYAVALYNMAMIRGQQGNSQAAAGYLSRYLQVEPNRQEARLQLGLNYAQRGRLKEALRQFQELIRLAPRDPAAHNQAGLALSALGRDDEARACFETAVSLNPRDLDARVNLATMFEKLGRREEAQEHYAAALSINPADSEARAALQRLENQSHPPSPADAGRPGAATRSPPDP